MAGLVGACSPALPSPDELACVEQIRSDCRAEIAAMAATPDDVVGDLRICRFLRSRHGDVAEATEWFRDFLRWRVESGIETWRSEVVGKSPEDLLRWYDKRRNPYVRVCPYGGRNKDGNILWYIYVGYNDPVNWVNHRQVSTDEDLKTFYQLMEWTLWHLDVLSRQEGRMLYCIKIGDLNHLGEDGRKIPIFVPEFKHFFFQLLNAFQKTFCEHDTLFVILNAPLIFRAVFAIVKLVLTRRQLSKVRVIGDSTQEEVRELLREAIPEEILPMEYGGRVERLVGWLPLDTPAEIQAWYETRHLLPAEDAPAPLPTDAGVAPASGK